MSSDNNTLVESKVALSVFLESLLKETELVEDVEVEVKAVETARVSLVAEPKIEVIPEALATVDVSEEIIELPVVSEIEPVIESAVELELHAEPAEEIIDDVYEIPAEPFQALIFKVAGLSLAVRLIELNGVVVWDDTAITEMPGHSPFYLGLLQYLGKSIPIVDTARLVFPEDKLVALSADKPYERVKRIVLIDDGKWGLACDEVDEVIELNAEAVKWRQNRRHRKWMAGTVIQHMCALIDGSGFSEMLTDGTHNRK